MPRIPIQKQRIKPKNGPDRRGNLSKLLRTLRVGDVIKCPPGKPKHPHQTIYYHNCVSEKEKTPFRWSAEAPLRPNDPWIIKRVA